MRILAAAFVLLLYVGELPAQTPAASPDAVVLKSPDGRLVATFASADPARFGPWRFRLDRATGSGRVEVLGWSPLGLAIDGAPLADLAWVSEEPTPPVVHDRYTLPAGKRRDREYITNARPVRACRPLEA